MLSNRVAVARVQQIQVFVCDVLAVVPLKSNVLLDDPSALSQNVFALL